MNTISVIMTIIAAITLIVSVIEGIQLNKLNKQNAELNTENQKLKTEIDSAEKEKTNLQQRIDKTLKSYSDLKAQYDDALKAEAQLRADLSTHISTYGNLEDIKYNIEKANTELEQTKAEQASVDATLHQSKLKIEEAEEKLSDIEAEIEEKKRNLHELEDRLMSYSKLEHSDSDTEAIQAEIEVLNTQIEACKQTAELSEKIAKTMDLYRQNVYHSELLCDVTPSLITCIIVGLNNDGNIAFAYPIVSYSDFDTFKKGCERYNSSGNYETYYEAYGIFLDGTHGEDERKRLMSDIGSHENLKRIVVITSDTTKMVASNKTLSFRSANVQIDCGHEVAIVHYSESTDGKTDNNWSDICGWRKKFTATDAADKLKSRITKKQHELEENIVTNSQLFMADALLSQQ